MYNYVLIQPDRYPDIERTSRRFTRYAVILWIASFIFFYLPKVFLVLTIPLSLAIFLLALCYWSNTRRLKIGLRWRQAPALPYPLSLRYELAHGAFFMGAFVLFHQTLYSVTLPHLAAVPYMSLLMPGLVIGLTLLHAGYFLREPAPLSCPACSYSLEGLSLPTDCPECKQPIPTPDAAVGIVRNRRPTLGNIGAAITAVSFFLLISAFYRPGPVLNWIPTANRIAMAPTDPKAFRSLINGNLDSADASALTDAILDAAEEDRSNLGAQLDWVDTRLATGTLTDEQTIRYLFGGTEFSIAAEGRPTVGRPITLRLNTAAPFRARSTRVRSAYFFSGFEITPPVPVEQPPTGDARLGIDDPLGPSARPAAEITPDAPGRMTIQTRVVLAAIPYTQQAPAITWHDDGTYTITPQPLTTDERTIETTVDVAP